ncbi:MAG: hypothetical protein IH801_06995 [Nitrospinae bacterium]|nr:hypothetical protein [Nitrospinota bacterium]
MKQVILGTAGHIDHGKTALVKALTGIDTDRLKEEKERGITIDLGFAHLSLGPNIICGVVDSLSFFLIVEPDDTEPPVTSLAAATPNPSPINNIIVLTARLNSAQPIAGLMYELDAIAATVIGGTSLMGGEGTLVGTLIGALIMGVLRNGLNLLGVSSFLQQIFIGSVIIAAVLVDAMLKSQRK